VASQNDPLNFTKDILLNEISDKLKKLLKKVRRGLISQKKSLYTKFKKTSKPGMASGVNFSKALPLSAFC